jgi:molybdopterin-containing oxidoreductase family iron-sulfur binding subunit
MSHEENPAVPVEFHGVRRSPSGRKFWKSLDEWAGTAEFRQWLDREFPVQASEWDDPAGRRNFLKLMGASLALAGVGGACTRQPTEKIVPYVKMPEEIIPGRPLYYATAVRHGGYAKGVLVETHMGRPTKVEGNPEHPASLGATDIFGQAEILQLYDPDRSQTVKFLGEVRTFASFVEAMRQAVATHKPARGAAVRILTETVTSPTLIAEIEALLADLPDARWHQWEPAARTQSQAGTELAFGTTVDVQYRLEDADVIVSLDGDFMTERPDNLALIRAFSRRRKVAGVATSMNRLYMAESTPTITGAAADHRLPMRAADVEGFARALAAACGIAVTADAVAGRRGDWISAIARDLREHVGKSIVIAGETQPPIVHALAHALNEKLGNVGHTVVYTKRPASRALAGADSLAALTADMLEQKVALLLVLGSNPVYAAPADIRFKEGLRNVKTAVHLGLYEDETAELCHWHVPATHDFETWGDAVAQDGTITIQQPLIQPLYDGKNPLEVLATLSDKPQRSAHEIVRAYWQKHWSGLGEFEPSWRRALHDGRVLGPAVEEVSVSVRKDALAAPATSVPAGLELQFRTDPGVYDGRYSNNGWLQELPRPLTKLTWDNAAHVSPKTAVALGVKTGDVVRLKYQGRETTAPVPVYVMPGQPDDAVTVHLGYGRARSGRVGGSAREPLGFSAYELRTNERPWFGGGLTVEKIAGHARLAMTQDHWSMEDPGGSVEDREIIRLLPVRQYQEEPASVRELGEEPKPDDSLYPPHKYEGHAWGMAIDLNACVGCNSCIIACQSENNIPVVGKDQVARGREMQWLRVDRYFYGDPERSETVQAHFAPIPCMHCENAPCEVVCPVAATSHSDEGLNDMVYNRCVGTRYCSNNCPYKVRRFNFLLYQDWETPSLKFMRNPDVSVRSRGVMEKCSYCVQRIQAARIEAKVHDATERDKKLHAGVAAEDIKDRGIEDGRIQTACQQVCPAQAITFGDINDSQSRVSKLKAEPRNYGLLAELNTRPRTTYLAALRNPNPEIPREGEHHG